MSEGNGEVSEAQVVAKSHEGVVELRAGEMEPLAGASTQREQDLWTPEDTIEPPETLQAFQTLTRQSAIRDRCLDALTRNTVGLGWDVSVWPEHDQDVDHKTIRNARHALDSLARRDKRLDRPSFTTLMSAVKHDLEECGNAYIEVSRNQGTGKIDGLYHLPGGLVRRKKDRDGWVMGQVPELVAGDATRTDYFNFGEKVDYSSSGRPQPRLGEGVTRWRNNEVIAFRHYTAESRDYGLPRDSALYLEYAAARYVAEWSQSFFKGSGTPPTILFVQGQEQRDGSRVRFRVDNSIMRRIQQAVTSEGDPGRRVVVVPVPPGTQVHTEQLSKLSDRDITFGDFRKDHRRNVGSSFGLMPVFYGDVDDAGRYTAEVQRALTLEETFDPDQKYIEDKLWTTLMVDLGYSELMVKFKRLAVESDAARREAANNGADRGLITVGEWRHANGYGPLSWDGDPNDPENPNNKLVDAKKGAPTRPDEQHGPVEMETEDERGLKPGIGGRGPARDKVAKEEHGPDHVEDAVEELAEELAEYGPTERE